MGFKNVLVALIYALTLYHFLELFNLPRKKGELRMIPPPPLKKGSPMPPPLQRACVNGREGGI